MKNRSIRMFGNKKPNTKKVMGKMMFDYKSELLQQYFGALADRENKKINDVIFWRIENKVLYLMEVLTERLKLKGYIIKD